MKHVKSGFWLVLLGGSIMAVGLILMAFDALEDETMQLILINSGMVMTVIGLLSAIQKKEMPLKDELTRRIADRAAANSWTITLFSLLALFWIDYLGIIEFNVNSVIFIMFVIMIGTMLYFQQSLWKKGDI